MIAPPLLVSYSSFEDYLEALDPGLRRLHENRMRGLIDRGLPPVVSARCLATLFGYSTKFVNAMAQQNWKYYRVFTIRQGKKRREIQAPKVAIKVIQKWFGYHLAKAITFEDFVCGFVSGKSAPLAAAQHVNARWVYSVDINNFFPSTPNDAVAKSLIQIGYSDRAASLLAGLLCYRRALAQGSPASPVISNLVFNELDQQLKQLAHENNLRFTRYADDIVFSGTDKIPSNLKDQVRALFENTYWKLSADKEYYAEIPNRLKVHGLLVHGDRVRLTKGYRNKIRAYKHLLEKGQIKDEDIKRIKGHIQYAKSIDNFEN